MAFIVLYDACVLYPAPLRDLLMRLARTELFRAKWTAEILDECFDGIRRQRPDLDADKLARTRELMIRAVPDCLVTGYEGLVTSFELPDPDDRHVLAAAVRAGAQIIVTANTRHFPDKVLEQFGIEAQDADEFVVNLIDIDAATVPGVVTAQAADLRNPPTTIEQLLALFERQGLNRAVAALRPWLEP